MSATTRRGAGSKGTSGSGRKATGKARRQAQPTAARKAAGTRSPPAKAASRKKAPTRATPRKSTPRKSTPRKAAPRKTSSSRPATARAAPRPSESTLERRVEVLLHTTCLKAGTAAAAGGLTRRVPMLGRLAPVLMGDWLERHSVDALQEQLVRDVLALYGLELSEAEEQGVVLLATGARVGAGELSQRTVNDLVARFGAPFGRMLLDRVLPITTMVAENAAAVASTYAVGRRAQALCRLSLSDASNIGELLANITGIDQNRLVNWSGEALKLALKPFRRVLGSLNPLG